MDRAFSVPLFMALLGFDLFALDTMLPFGSAGGALYAGVVIAAWFLPTGKTLVGAATATSVLTITGFLLSRPGADLWAALSNRGFSLLTIWGTAAIILYFRGPLHLIATTQANDHPHAEPIPLP